MSKEIIPKGSKDAKDFPTFEEFKELGSMKVPAISTIDKMADRYDEIPLLLKALKNFDPTGCISAFADVLAEIKAKRNEEKFWLTLYGLYTALYMINQKFENSIDPEYKSQVIPLIEMYFDYSMRAYQLEKIELFRNAFINGVIDYDKTFDEKENISKIISALTIEQIRILKFAYVNNFSNLESKSVNKTDISTGLGLTEPYVQHLCHDLIGKGLLFGVNTVDVLNGGEYDTYRIGDYLPILIKYIKESPIFVHNP